MEFSGVERFLETPVKRYSSGMHVRLAFAVAAHLEPEVLLVDEVLAVGDAEFQQKCLGKMRDVASHGRTVVFVSHSLGAIRRLCDRAILLDRGGLAADGAPADVIATYMEQTLPAQSAGSSEVPPDASRLGTGEIRLRRVAVTGDDGEPLAALHLNQRFRIVAVFEAAQEIGDAVVEFGISTFGGDRIATVQSMDREGPLLSFPAGHAEVSAELETSLLPGEFTIDVGIHRRSGDTIDYVADALRLTALNAAEVGSDHYPWSVVRGFVRPSSNWSAVRETTPVGPRPTEGAGVTGIAARGRAHAVGVAGMVARALPAAPARATTLLRYNEREESMRRRWTPTGEGTRSALPPSSVAADPAATSSGASPSIRCSASSPGSGVSTTARSFSITAVDPETTSPDWP